jgi:hypothetical protein
VTCLVALFAGASVGITQTDQNKQEKGVGRYHSILVNGLFLFCLIGAILLGGSVYRWWVMPWTVTSDDILSEEVFKEISEKEKTDLEHPYHHMVLGDLYLEKALNPKISESERERYFGRAQHEYEAFKRLDPYSLEYYRRISRLYVRQSRFDMVVQILEEFEEKFPNAIEAKLMATLRYLEMSLVDNSENPIGSPYFSKAKAAVQRTKRHRPSSEKMRDLYFPFIYRHFRSSNPNFLKVVVNSTLLSEEIAG